MKTWMGLVYTDTLTKTKRVITDVNGYYLILNAKITGLVLAMLMFTDVIFC